MTNEELVDQLRRIAQGQNTTNEDILLLAADRIKEMDEYCLQMGVRYE